MRKLSEYGRSVDVVVGGQWGSEGKGSIANFLAPEYGTLMRVGGPNAGHYVLDDDGAVYCHRQIPSGSRRRSKDGDMPFLLIGPGATLREDLLLKEIAECGAAGRLMIHPQAAIITDADIEREQELVAKIGSTAQGVGQCAARRILRDGTTVMAGEVPSLRQFIGDTTFELECLMDAQDVAPRKILLEGTQGTSLSLFHGSYPKVTSRDTSVAGTCAEAGISPRFVDRVYMVIRTYPIRVGTGGGEVSGPMGDKETSWDAVAKRAGLDAEELKDQERGSVSLITRRVAEFDMDQCRENAFLNGATDLALTFADYLDPENKGVTRYEDLTEETRDFIESVEQHVGLPVSLVSVGFYPGCIIDRRTP